MMSSSNEVPPCTTSQTVQYTTVLSVRVICRLLSPTRFQARGLEGLQVPVETRTHCKLVTTQTQGLLRDLWIQMTSS